MHITDPVHVLMIYWFILNGIILVRFLSAKFLSDWFSRYLCLIFLLFISFFWYFHVCLRLLSIHFHFLWMVKRKGGQEAEEGEEGGERGDSDMWRIIIDGGRVRQGKCLTK